VQLLQGQVQTHGCHMGMQLLLMWVTCVQALHWLLTAINRVQAQNPLLVHI
jgi:hypothetical protein